VTRKQPTLPSLDAMVSQIPQHEPLYPDRPLTDCRRCGCEHFEGGRCFAQDAHGWPIVRAVRDGERFRRELRAIEGLGTTIAQQMRMDVR